MDCPGGWQVYGLPWWMAGLWIALVDGRAMDVADILNAIRDTGWNEFSGSEQDSTRDQTTRTGSDTGCCKERQLGWEQTTPY